MRLLKAVQRFVWLFTGQAPIPALTLLPLYSTNLCKIRVDVDSYVSGVRLCVLSVSVVRSLNASARVRSKIFSFLPLASGSAHCFLSPSASAVTLPKRPPS